MNLSLPLRLISFSSVFKPPRPHPKTPWFYLQSSLTLVTSGTPRPKQDSFSDAPSVTTSTVCALLSIVTGAGLKFSTAATPSFLLGSDRGEMAATHAHRLWWDEERGGAPGERQSHAVSGHSLVVILAASCLKGLSASL